ncbi:hypothetical protein KVR01_012741 [Diaporthe batatas]|uniref:uncharacterized protein n=1 Tax=Diaporthe batatas TaxID=748121 RepID=UPI001D055364|nr:uncharacterized protein KVR01_012741 [Diaporthe batatas]KAG8157357.1 hypothetical protein KVR01_012741 [Diaporthe batatas]
MAPKTIGEYKSRIEFSSLNALYRESITLLRDVGIYYFWIDALCIIQDDRKDWRQEASKMADVYSNAYLTISASVSESPDDEIITNICRPRVRGPELRIDRLGKLVDETFQSIAVAALSRSPDDPDFGADVQNAQGAGSPNAEAEVGMTGPESGLDRLFDVDLGSLATRGWCLQERCLSRRILHFGEAQMHWQCLEAQLSEEPQDEDRVKLLARHYSLLLPSSSQFILRKDMPLDDPYDLWYRIMEDYKRRLMTNTNDRIPGILGLTQVFRGATRAVETATKARGHEDTMVCGLWKGDLAFGLLWKISHKDVEGFLNNKMPSWSFLRTNARVWWPLNRYGTRKNTTLAVDIQDLDVDETKNLIKLRGKLIPIPRSMPKADGSDQVNLGWAEIGWDFDPFREEDLPSNDDELRRLLWFWDHGEEKMPVGTSDGDTDDGKSDDGSNGDGNADDVKVNDGNADERSDGDTSTGDGSNGDGNADDVKVNDGNADERSDGDTSTGDGSNGDGNADDVKVNDGNADERSDGDTSTGDGSNGDGNADDVRADDGSSDERSTDDGSSGYGSEGDGSEGDGKTDDGNSQISLRRNIWLLMVVTPNEQDFGHGLLLLETETKGTYHRVGYVLIGKARAGKEPFSKVGRQAIIIK